MELLTFHLGDREFGVELGRVRELLAPPPPISRVPSTPAAVLGVAGLRGDPTPVVDAGLRLEGRPIALGPRTPLLVLHVIEEGRPVTVGLLVEAAGRRLDVERMLSWSDALSTFAGADACIGFADVDGRIVLILDVDQLLATDRIAAARNALAPPPLPRSVEPPPLPRSAEPPPLPASVQRAAPATTAPAPSSAPTASVPSSPAPRETQRERPSAATRLARERPPSPAPPPAAPLPPPTPTAAPAALATPARGSSPTDARAAAYGGQATTSRSTPPAPRAVRDPAPLSPRPDAPMPRDAGSPARPPDPFLDREGVFTAPEVPPPPAPPLRAAPISPAPRPQPVPIDTDEASTFARPPVAASRQRSSPLGWILGGAAALVLLIGALLLLATGKTDGSAAGEHRASRPEPDTAGPSVATPITAAPEPTAPPALPPAPPPPLEAAPTPAVTPPPAHAPPPSQAVARPPEAPATRPVDTPTPPARPTAARAAPSVEIPRVHKPLPATMVVTSETPACEIYDVRKGDTLWQISAERLGSPYRWPILFGENRDRILDPDVIEVHDRIRIPGACKAPERR